MGFDNILNGTELQQRAARVLNSNLGYHRVDVAALLAGGTWALYIVGTLTKARGLRVTIYAAAAVTFLALNLTGGRAGLVACVVVGVVLSLMRWRRLLIIAPVIALLTLLAIPAVQQRITEGFSEESFEHGMISAGVDTVTESGRDLYAITSGRALVWPYVVRKIEERPFVGFGQKAMLREGVAIELIHDFGPAVAFAHPHNAYLELLVDSGIIGILPVIALFALLLALSLRMFTKSTSPVAIATGGICLAFVLAQLTASVGAQSFYPRQSSALMWWTIALMLRTYFAPYEQRSPKPLTP